MTALLLEGIGKSFGAVEVLHSIDLHLEQGETLALLGENGAGKSTLMKIVSGLERPDRGTIRIGETSATALTPRESRRLGVRFVTQELTNADDLSVAENISLGRLDRSFGTIRWRLVRERARRVLAELGILVDVDALVGGLSLGERQCVEIARAVSDDASVVVLDEPTAALSDHEAERLFEIMAALANRGVAMIFISHRLDEVIRVADRVQVLRDGSTVLSASSRGLSQRDIVTAMVGGQHRSAEPSVSRASASFKAVLASLALDGASDGSTFYDIDLRVRPHEIVMVYGKLGSGAAEIVQAAVGDRPLTAGAVQVRGSVMSKPSTRSMLRAGVGYVPADRKRDALFGSRSVAENISATSWGDLAGPAGLITARRELSVYRRWRDRLQVSAPGGAGAPVATLSGGNQQKIVLGRWLEKQVDTLALSEPTRGVDIAARQQIYGILREMAASGRAIIAATSDLDEVVQCADRAVVVNHGRIVAELQGDDINSETITHLAAG